MVDASTEKGANSLKQGDTGFLSDAGTVSQDDL